MKRLQGQTAIVTGSSSGLGQGIAIEMGQEGANVCINYHSDEEGANKTLRAIEEAGAQGFVMQADVSDPDDVSAMFKKTVDTFGTVDILMNNAGIQKDAAFMDMSHKDWQKVVDVNLSGQFYCAQAAAQEFIRRGPTDYSKALGKIICMSSVHDIIPWAGHINYATSKGGVLMFIKTLAQELGPQKIRVNGISPGAIKTDINEDVWDNEKQLKELLTLIPYQRIGETKDVGKLAVWLASDESDYIHGQTIYIDGGMTLYPGFVGNG